MARKKITFLLFFLLVIALGALLVKFHSYIDNDIAVPLRKLSTNFSQSISIIPTPQNSIKHVFVIVEENHNWDTIDNNPNASYINNTLLKQGAYASNYHNVPTNIGELHPSEPNYIFLESGVIAFPDHTFTSDDDPSAVNSTASKNHVTALLDKKGYTWKSYQEGITGDKCPIYAEGDYAPKHNPMLFFQDVSGNPPDEGNTYCKDHVRLLSELEHDIKTGNLPNYVFITPNLQHDMHNGTIKEADTWLAQIVPQITNAAPFKKDGALFITWDEGTEGAGETGGNNPIGMIMLSPFIKKGYTNNTPYSHASYVKTVEEIFSLPLTGFAKDPQTNDLLGFFR